MSLTIHQWIEKGKDLPVLSGSIGKIMSLTQSEESDVSQIAEVIKTDLGLSVAILRITNSSAFGMLKKITTIDQAVVLLGFNAVRNIALAVGVINLFSPRDKALLSEIWQRSLLTGIASRELSSLNGNKKNEDAFTSGILVDIGLIAFYFYDSQKASELLSKAENQGRMNLDEERQFMGIDHVEAGRLLAEQWKLPDDIIYTILHHHDEPQTESNSYSGKEKLSHLVYLGSVVGDIFYFGKKQESISKFIENTGKLIGISPEISEHLLHNIHPQLVEIASHFDISVGSGNTFEEILTKANEEIVNIAVSNEVIKHHLTQAFEREKKVTAKLNEANRKLQEVASKDALTGLYNRKFLNELLEKEWHRSIRYNYSLSVVMVDIDDFKRVNDTYGHKAGDMVLIKIAETLMKRIRKNDILARYGGEEFVFVLPQTDLRDACKVTSSFKAAAQDIRISFNSNNGLSLTISCGVSTAYPAMEGDSMDALIQRADNALYEAKRSGKDRIAFKERDIK